MTEIEKLKEELNNISLTIPQSYDDTLTFFEYMNELLYAFENIADVNFLLDSDYNAATYTLTLKKQVTENAV